MSNAEMKCLICGCDRWRRIFRKGERDFILCDQCAVVRLHPLPTLGELQKHYDREYRLETGMGAARAAEHEMERFTAQHRLGIIRQHAQGKNWLDIGCATGVLMQEALNAGLNCTGIDLSEQAVGEAQRKKLRAYATTTEEFRSDTSYDVITAFDVIEHVLDPVSFLDSVSRLLRPGGVLALTTPDTSSIFCRMMRQRWYFYIPEEHLFYFNCSNLSMLLARVGFNVVYVSRARKALNYRYSEVQFQAYNPLIHRVWKSLGDFVPPSYRQKPLKLYIGEMMVLAQKPA